MESANVSPLQAIADWLQAQPMDIQEDVGAMVLMLLEDESSFERHSNPVPFLLEWLNKDSIGIREIGKALTFKALFEHVFVKRFTEAGWVRPEKMFRSVITEGATDHDSDAAKIAPSAFRMLRALPERKELWKAAGITWTALVSEHLTEEALDAWNLSHMKPI
jgi:hypothetical protein